MCEYILKKSFSYLNIHHSKNDINCVFGAFGETEEGSTDIPEVPVETNPEIPGTDNNSQPTINTENDTEEKSQTPESQNCK
jgi:hypothetical protein